MIGLNRKKRIQAQLTSLVKREVFGFIIYIPEVSNPLDTNEYF